MTGWCVYFSVFVSSLHKSELLGSLGLARDTRKGFGKRMAEEWSSGKWSLNDVVFERPIGSV